MKISIIGTGYVGLVTGACFAELGVHVTCVDKDEAKITLLRQGISPIYEEGLPELLKRNLKTRRLVFSTDIQSAVSDSKIIFICVNTPSRETDGSADLADLHKVADDIVSAIDGYTVIVIKSTVPVGTSREVKRYLKALNPAADIDVVSNPEFLSEGSSVFDFMNPARVVVGVNSQRAREVMRELYLPLSLQGIPFVYCSPETSEMIKYASNAFLATKITFINEMADLCEQTGVDVNDLAYGIGLDDRIGTKHLQPGPGFGGLCFPKDTVALVHTARNVGSPVHIIETVVEINNQRKINMAARVVNACDGSVAQKKISILGLTFKPGTDDLRDSPSIAVIMQLQERGAVIRAHDPLGVPNARKQLQDVAFFDDVYDAITGTDAVVIATAWPEYGRLDLERVKTRASEQVIVDFHNMYDLQVVRDAGIRYLGIGRGQRDMDVEHAEPKLIRTAS